MFLASLPGTVWFGVWIDIWVKEKFATLRKISLVVHISFIIFISSLYLVCLFCFKVLFCDFIYLIVCIEGLILSFYLLILKLREL